MDCCKVRVRCGKRGGNSGDLGLELNRRLTEVYTKLKRVGGGAEGQGYRIVVNKENVQVKPPKLIEIDLRDKTEQRALGVLKTSTLNKPLSEHSVIKKVKTCCNPNLLMPS